LLRLLAGLLLRGSEGRFIRRDLDELLERDRERGMTRPRAIGRYLRNLLGSVLHHRFRHLRAPRVSRVSWLDFKLGARMLVKNPGLTLVGGLGMTVAIAIGAASFGVIENLIDPTLPLEEGDRVVAIQSREVAGDGNPERGSHLHDLTVWREELESVVDLGAYRMTRRNLIVPGGGVEPVRIAEMTASGFRLARVAPLLGRTLVEADQRPGAARVLVIGHDAWLARFAGDRRVVGTTVSLGGVAHTVVGVMPEGFAFPVNHVYWVSLRLDPSDYERSEAPSIDVFGRLADGFTLAEARAEMESIDAGLAATFPHTHEHLRTEILPYTHPFFDIDSPETFWSFRLLQLLVSLLLVVVGANVAILVYARTVTRTGEIAVRSALGASRSRIVAQLFAEALVLSAGAAALGLVIAGVFFGRLETFLTGMAGDEMGGRLPFWLDFRLSAETVLYVVALTVLAALIVGVAPALRTTSLRVSVGLGRLGAAGSGIQLGRTWSLLIVAQVALAVGVMPPALFQAGEALRFAATDPGFAAQDFLTARLYLDTVAEAGAYEGELASRFATLQTELLERLEAEPGVSQAITTMGAPGEEPSVWVEVEGVPMPSERSPGVRQGTGGHLVGIGRVDLDAFDVFDVPILTGRGFAPGDLDAATSAVVVNRTFAQGILGDGEVLGHRLRYVGRGGDVSEENVELGRWYEIVGLVPDFPNATEPDRARAKVYHPLAPGEVHPASIALRTSSMPPASLAPRLREIAAELDPELRVGSIETLDAVLREEQWILRVVALTLAFVTLSVLLLSAAGIYALMSFTVAKRQREIGIRAALGAHPRRLLAAVFARALAQLGAGVAIGVVATMLLDLASGGELMGERGALWIPAVALLMAVVGALASVGPARRGLRVQPTDALRQE